MKKKLLVCSLLVIMVLSIASTALGYDGYCLTSFRTDASYSFKTSNIGKNTMTMCRASIYGTYYTGSADTYLSDNSGNQKSNAHLAYINTPYEYTPTVAGTYRLKIINHDWYGHYEIHAIGSYTKQ